MRRGGKIGEKSVFLRETWKHLFCIYIILLLRQDWQKTGKLMDLKIHKKWGEKSSRFIPQAWNLALRWYASVLNWRESKRTQIILNYILNYIQIQVWAYSHLNNLQ